MERICSEPGCGNSLAGLGPKALSCSPECRKARHARQVREKRRGEVATVKAFASAADDKTKHDIIKQAVREQVEPVVRAALANETLAAISKLVKLVPSAIDALEEDLLGDDPLLRQRAYSLLIKYTAGHPAIVRPDDATGAGQMVVNFNLPRPDSNPQELNADEVIEMKTCDLCDTAKPSTEMVAGANRCQSCMDRWKAEIQAAVAS